jgi:hypothetical protein
VNDHFTILIEVGGAAAINTVYQLQRGKDPLKSLVASGILYGALLVISDLLDPGVAVAIGALLLLSVFLTRGDALMKLVSALVK